MHFKNQFGYHGYFLPARFDSLGKKNITETGEKIRFSKKIKKIACEVPKTKIPLFRLSERQTRLLMSVE